MWQTAYKWLRQINNKINKEFIRNKIVNHDDYPALTALTDFLDSGGMAYNTVLASEEHFPEMNYPLLAHMKEHGNQYLIIINNQNEWNKNEIKNQWSGVTIFPEKNSIWQSNQNENAIKQNKLNKGYLSIGIGAVISFYILNAIKIDLLEVNIFGFFSIVGLLISIFILGEELGTQNKIVKQVCGVINKEGCGYVLKSKFAYGIGGFTTGDITLVYFLIQFTAWLLYTVNPIIFNIAAAVALAGIIVAALSVYLQKVILKQWCTLCLIIVSVLLIQFIIVLSFITTFFAENSFTPKNILLFAVLGIVLLALFYPLKTLLKTNYINSKKANELNKWKTDGNLFKVLWQQEAAVDNTIWGNDLILGNPDAPLRITVACNPYCGPCADAHSKLNTLLEKYGNAVCVQLRFLCNTQNMQNERTVAVQAILQKTTVLSKSELPLLFTDWFETMDYTKWISKWAPDTQIDVTSHLHKHEIWVNQSNIAYTPTIFINGKKIPGKYNLDELEALIPTLKETLL
jgi:uncharacterized membrane protein/glutaredoxin